MSSQKVKWISDAAILNQKYSNIQQKFFIITQKSVLGWTERNISKVSVFIMTSFQRLGYDDRSKARIHRSPPSCDKPDRTLVWTPACCLRTRRRTAACCGSRPERQSVSAWVFQRSALHSASDGSQRNA